jgi:hypothetical protein
MAHAKSIRRAKPVPPEVLQMLRDPLPEGYVCLSLSSFFTVPIAGKRA